jgi:hypothetical protein
LQHQPRGLHYCGVRFNRYHAGIITSLAFMTASMYLMDYLFLYWRQPFDTDQGVCDYLSDY